MSVSQEKPPDLSALTMTRQVDDYRVGRLNFRVRAYKPLPDESFYVSLLPGSTSPNPAAEIWLRFKPRKLTRGLQP